MEIWKKVMFVLFLSSSLFWVVLAIPYLTPKTELIMEPYPWFVVGADTVKDHLWDSNLRMFRESVKENESYWIDDQSKLLGLFLEDAKRYETNITRIVETLHNFIHDGYLPRRYVKTDPQIVNSTLSNFEMKNGFLKVKGNLNDPDDEANPLIFTYYEASGKVDFAYLYGQLFIVDPETGMWDWITYDPVNLRAEQIQNPGFDHNSSTSEIEWYVYNFVPWEFSFPKNWSWNNSPPIYNVYLVDTGKNTRHIGFEIPSNITEKDWRNTNKFAVDGDTGYTLHFNYKGTIDYGEARIYFRYFNASGWISEDVLTLTSSNNTDLWASKSLNVTTPVTATSGDIRIVAPENLFNGKAYFDVFSGVPVENPSFETPDGYPFTNGTYNTRYRSLKILESEDYARQRLVKTISVSQVYNLTYQVKAVSPPHNYDVLVFYDDLSYSTFSKSCNSDTWVSEAVQKANLNAGKTVYAVAFRGNNGEIGIDDVAFHYKPVNAVYSSNYKVDVDSATKKNNYVESIQSYEDDDVNLTVRFRFERDKAYLQEIMEATNKHASSYSVDVHCIASVNQLSTITSGEESRKTAYSSVWIPGIGRRYPDPNSAMTPLLDENQEEYNLWRKNYDYYVFELRQIPEWSGCLGLAYNFPYGNVPYYMQNTRNPNSTLWGADTGKYLHYVTTSFRKPIIKPTESTSVTINIFALNGYDFVNPGIINYYMRNLGNYDNVDLSLNFHLGQISYALSRYREVIGVDPYDMASGIIHYYSSIFNGHNNGTYLMNTGKMVEACLKMNRLTGDSFYNSFAQNLANHLVNNQLSDGRFPMKHNNITYLDCQGVSVIALRLMGSNYESAYTKGLEAFHYDYLPSGYHRIPTGYIGDDVPHEKRLFVYANSTHIDDDFWTYKSSYIAKASLGKNDTLTMLGLSRVWSRTVWSESSLLIYNSESLPDNKLTISGEVLEPEINSETHPWGLIVWYDMAKHQRSSFNYYYMFLDEHRAIIEATITKPALDVKIYGWNNKGTVSRFYLKGKEQYCEPSIIKVDGSTINKVDSLSNLESSGVDCYFHNESSFNLYVKVFPKNMDEATLHIKFTHITPEFWMPILPLMGTFGFIMLCISLVYGIGKVKNGEFLEGSAIALLLFLIGFALIVAWLWSV